MAAQQRTPHARPRAGSPAVGRRPAKLRAGVLAAVGLGMAACTGGLGHRSVATVGGSADLPSGVTGVRFALENASLRVLAGVEPKLTYEGILRRAADTAEGLARLEELPAELVVGPDPDRPGLLLVRGALQPPDLQGSSVLGLELTARLPAHLALSVEVRGSGHLEVEDRDAPVDLDTSRGDLRATRCSAGARLRTGTGMTIVYQHGGPLDVEAGVGDMQVFVREPGEHVRLVTGKGSVQCYVPRDTGFRLDARAETGKVANGFGIPLQRSGYSSAMVGRHGDGRTEIVMRSSSGFLSLSYTTGEVRRG